jgi:O-antigen/teichoic acid export membrane protein
MSSPDFYVTEEPVVGFEPTSPPVLASDPDRDRLGKLARDPALHDLKRKTAHGTLISTCGQVASLILRTGSMMVLARLLSPADFGLLGMATVCTGFVALFQDLGLSMATVQCRSITHAQASMLFWINLAAGLLLAGFCAVTAPVLTGFFHEPRLFWMTMVIGAGFIFSGASAQHRAMLMRGMRFSILTTIDILSLCASVGLGIGMAAFGLGYWALVGMAVCGPVLSAFVLWLVSGWLPGPPRRGTPIWSMLKFGGATTLDNLIVYFAYNADKVLLGRFWGTEMLGIYGRAYQLVNLPTQNLYNTVSAVAFPALSRLQHDPERLRNYFLKGYGLFLSLVLPITTACLLFAEDIIQVFLGPKWGAAVPIFRLLSPTIFVFALINPISWLLMAEGRAVRNLKLSLLIAPVVIVGYLAGLSHGPNGVAAGFSIAALLLVVPVIAWSTPGTSITTADAFRVILRPLLSILVAAGATLAAWGFVHVLTPPLLRLFIANVILFGVYGIMLAFVMGQKEVYLGLLREIGLWPASRKQTRNVESGR